MGGGVQTKHNKHKTKYNRCVKEQGNGLTQHWQLHLIQYSFIQLN